MFKALTLGMLLLGQALAVESLRVGDHVLLLTGSLRVGSRTLVSAFLTDAQGRQVPRSPWLGRPLTVTAETTSAYRLSGGAGQVWLPRRNLGTKAVFPLTRDAETKALAARLSGQNVWPFGLWHVPCEVMDGFYADLTLKGARVEDVWRLQDLSPTILLVLGKPQGMDVLSLAYGGVNQGYEGEARAQIPARCTTLPALYTNVAEVERRLSLSRPAPPPALPNDPAGQERALIGWTREQVYVQYGSPNEPGTRADLNRLPTWTYGAGGYDFIRVDFGPSGRVVRASIARSP
ncbi:hypothetical protein DAERI_040143 [Deinococcus aerius]|uniref:Uncharacterized protein n=1 Tax=Deinococcus aerius TaxID=200253 RepID=A0A2I9CU74_9DEIO|nr:hypothetical protein [Deinococcus aerius]GBF05383.1 hypothetical protein DAERI_040143 [Deinococcus aerius]